MEDLVLSLSPEDRERFETLATRLGKSADACLTMAVEEFIQTWEYYLITIEACEGEERPLIQVPGVAAAK